MIRFSCYCGHAFVLDDSEAAGTVQCPDCRKLNDVPSLQDLANLDEEGVVALKPVEIAEEPERLAVLSKVYAKGRQDQSGNDIDFRPTPEDLARRGVPARAPEQAHRPRYDPETGQLLQPIEMAPLPPRPAIPVERPALAYARRGVINPPPRGAVELSRPMNIFTMVFVAMLMAGAGLMAFLVLVPFANLKGLGGAPTHMLLWVGPMVVLELLVFAHYGHVIEDLGPLEKDELPRMFGDVMLYENIFSPLRAVLLSLVMCYLPALIAFHLPVAALAVPVGALLTGAGTYFFPAVLLVLTTSQSLSNLRPDRLMATIHACGRSYFICVGSWIVAGSVYLLALLNFLGPVLGQLQPIVDAAPAILTMLLMVPVFHVLTVLPAHVFAWQTGMLYRRYYDAFPWVGQRHEKDIEAEKKV